MPNTKPNEPESTPTESNSPDPSLLSNDSPASDAGAESPSTTSTDAKGAGNSAARPIIRQDQKLLILGDYQTGKTTFAEHLLSRMPRYAVWDPTWAFPSGVHSQDDFKREFLRTGRAVYQPGLDGDEEELSEEFGEWCNWLLSQSNAMVFVDEPALVMTSRGMPSGFSKLHRLGHKRGLGVTLATHRYHGDIPALTRIAHHRFIFRVTVDTDLEALEGDIGREAVAIVREMPDYYYWYKGSKLSRMYPPIPIEAPADDSKTEGEG